MNQMIKQHALGLLARREHSKSELKVKLTRKGYDALDADRVVDQLAEANLQSDQRYCEGYISSRLSRGFGARYCAQALLQRGVDAGLVHSSLAERKEEFDQSLRDLWSRKYTRVSTDAAGYQKQFRFLLQRGFEPDRVRALLRDLERGNNE